MSKYFRFNRDYNNILKRILLFAFVVSIGVVSNLSGYLDLKVAAEDIKYDKIGSNEMRGVWIATVNNINFPSKTGLSVNEMKAEIDDIIKVCKETKLNAIFFQVRPTGDALYDSAYFPTSKYLTGKQGESFKGGFDPLKYIIEQSHKNNIELHAWINPYRITNDATKLEDLAKNNPAKKNPSWVVSYDGKLYYNPAIPEVQDLITSGVAEIVRKYDVDGIHFDDYFYPGTNFDDEKEYKKYGTKYSNIGDFRRANVNTLVEKVYKKIKELDKSVSFGISPRGIWANKSNRAPTGSDTAGGEAYFDIYCDAKAWINGGYIDYICPQIYWRFDTNVARYDKLVRWWSAAVDGTGVDLYIGHGAYRVGEWQSETEIPRQVEYARNYMGVTGSVFYGYANIADNSYKLKDNLAKMFASPRKINKPESNGGGVTFGRPANNSTVADATLNIGGSSNPAYPVYYNGDKIPRTKNGYFSLYITLNEGKNNLVFKQNNTDYAYNITKGKSNVYPGYGQMSSYWVEPVSYTMDGLSHTGNIVTSPGNKIILRVRAPSKSKVTAKLGDTVVSLTPLLEPPDEGTYMTEVYSGTLTLPSTKPNGKIIDLGRIVLTAERGGDKATFDGLNVKLINESVYKPYTSCEVVKDYSHLKVSLDTEFYNDYLPASVGMRDNITAYQNGYYKLGFGGWISADNVVLTPERTLLVNRLLSASMENIGKITEIKFAATEHVPVNAKCKDGVFTITLFNTPDGARQLALTDNPVFSSVKYSSDPDNKTVTYKFDLIDPDNWYGFDVSYEGGDIIVSVKNPIKKIPGSNKPLDGMTIIVDAGHGGSDTGALGFLSAKGKCEKDLNLDIALAVKTKLTALGADVIMTREKDITVDIYTRMNSYNAINPDLLISVHHNALGYGSDLSYVRGYLGLYCNDSGRLLAKSCSKSIATELNRYERDVRYQALAMLRSHRFPATLFEMSFITNPDEYDFAITSDGVQRSADAIAKGIIAWLDDQQKWVK